MSGAGNFTSTRPFAEDLKQCDCTGVGFQSNQLYLGDGHRRIEHELQDKFFHYKEDDNIALYGIFDGEQGVEAAEYAMQEMPGQILLGQLLENSSDSEIHEVLKQAFLSVERGYFQTIVDPLLVERVGISEASDGENSGDFHGNEEKIRILNKQITASTALLVVLIFNGKLYVANCGDCRAQLCITDSSQEIREVIQLSIDHDLKNEDELERLKATNVNLSLLDGKIGNHETTRCIGNYLVKGGYKENQLLSSATSEPVIAEPQIMSYPITDLTGFLILLSSGLCKALEEVRDHVNFYLVEAIMEEFGAQNTLNGVAQAVVDKVGRIHQELPRVCGREDMTLLVRNFNYPLRSVSRSSPMSDRYVRYASSSSSYTPTFTSPSGGIAFGIGGNLVSDPDSGSVGTETDSSDSYHHKTDSPEKIKPYVDFSNFFKALETNPELNENFFSLSD